MPRVAHLIVAVLTLFAWLAAPRPVSAQIDFGDIDFGDKDDDGESPTPVVSMEIPDVVTELGGTFELPIRIDSNVPLGNIDVHVENDPSKLRIVDWAPGAGLLAYVTAHGDPPECDIIIFPDGRGVMSIMIMDEPYSVSTYGNEWLILHYEVVTEEAGTETITGRNPALPKPVEASVEIHGNVLSQVDRFVRGDVNGDTQSDITDAVFTLSHLFLQNYRDIPCLDAADFNDDGLVTLTDPVQLINDLFMNNTPVQEDCQTDESADSLPECTESTC